MNISKFLYQKLAACVSPDALAALELSANEVRLAPGSFYRLYAKVPAIIPGVNVDCGPEFTGECVAKANGWQPMSITSVDLARLWLLLSDADHTGRLAERLDRLFETGELSELVVLYRALPLYPEPQAWKMRAAEGLRSNMTSVFQAVAHNNVFAARWLDEGPWNQLVVKALFTDSGLQEIVGLDERRNRALAYSLIDYVNERRAAGRSVDPWIWRCIAYSDDLRVMTALKDATQSDDEYERCGLALSLAESGINEAEELLALHPDLQTLAKTQNWESLNLEAYNNKKGTTS